jgi:Ca2+-binding RTX toxin-like protein
MSQVRVLPGALDRVGRRGRPIASKPRLAAGLFAIAAGALLSSPSSSLAAVSCEYSGADRLLTVSSTDSFTKLIRSGDEIVVDDGDRRIDCLGGQSTVVDTDRIQVRHDGSRADIVDLNGGPFAPGPTPEPGSAEIEIEFVAPTFLDIAGTRAADRLTFGAGGVNLNGDDDVDVTGRFTTLLIEGRAGNDLIAPQSDYGGTAGRRVLIGGAGRDTLISTPDGAVLHGGNGPDKLTGGARSDNLTGGRGSDRIRGGKGRDLIRAIDGTRDQVDCGRGFDRAKVDGIDSVKGCEKLIAVKKAGPVR